ncbi:MAG: DsbA family protein [Rhodospirillales bacterium]|nr:DsbA family protein [Rhodospirillales bacterium]
MWKRSLFKFGLAAALVSTLATPVLSQDTKSSLSGEQKREIERLIGEYIRTNPEIILESMRNLQERDRAAQQRRAAENLVSYRNELINDRQAPIGGNPEGDVTVVEFFDYRCTYCKRVYPAVVKLLSDDPNVRYVFKEFPILSPVSRIAAQAALAAWNIDKTKYVQFHTRLMATSGNLNEKRILLIAESSGLDSAKIKIEMNSPSIERALQANKHLAEKLGISGTPVFIIGNRLVPGAIDYSTLKKLVAEARDKS